MVRAQNISLGDQTKLWGQNLASRLIGFLVRSTVIMVAITLLALLCLGFALALVFWLVAPVLIALIPAIGLAEIVLG